MASGSGAIEQLALRFGLDLSPLKAGAGEIANILQKLNALSDEIVAKGKVQAAAQKVVTDEVKASANQAAAASKEQISLNRAATNEALSQLKLQMQEQRNAAAAQMAEIKRVEAERASAHREEMRRIQAENAARRKGAEGHEGALGALTKSLAGAFGGGMVGSVAGGLLMGGGIGVAIEGAVHGVEHLIDKIKELAESSSKLVLLEHEFDRLAKHAGVDPVKALQQLRQESEGLVSDQKLLAFAGAAMRGGSGLSFDQQAKLMGAVIKLGEVNARDMGPEQIIQMLSRAEMMGHPQMLRRVTGGGAEMQTLSQYIPKGDDAVARVHDLWQAYYKAIMKHSEAIGELPETIERTSKRLEVAKTNIEQGFGVGINKSEGTQLGLRMLTGAAGDLNTLTTAAEKAGRILGTMFGPAVMAIKVFVEGLKSVVEILEALLSPITSLFGVTVAKGEQLS